MALWRWKGTDINSEISTSDYIKKSGCYNCVIENVELFEATDGSFSTALNFNMINQDNEKCRIPIWIKDRKGEDLDFNIKHMNQLCFLLRLKPENIYAVTKDKKQYIPEFQGLKIGVFLEYGAPKDDEKYGQYNLKGFYDANTRKTAFETNKQIEAKKYIEMEKIFEKENLKTEAEKPRNNKNNNGLPYKTDKNIITESQMENDDEFPF